MRTVAASEHTRSIDDSRPRHTRQTDSNVVAVTLYLLGLASPMIAFDMTIVNVALPSIKAKRIAAAQRRDEEMRDAA